MFIRKANEADFERMMEIYRFAQEFMIRSGNPTQWGRFHPCPELIKNDIEKQISYVIYDADGIHGVFALMNGPDKTYSVIENGEWLNDEPYVVIHRIASDGEKHGIFKCASDYCKSLCDNVRVDTHADNLTMQSCIDKNGFVKCGIIHIENGTPRIAYHWTKG